MPARRSPPPPPGACARAPCDTMTFRLPPGTNVVDPASRTGFSVDGVLVEYQWLWSGVDVLALNGLLEAFGNPSAGAFLDAEAAVNTNMDIPGWIREGYLTEHVVATREMPPPRFPVSARTPVMQVPRAGVQPRAAQQMIRLSVTMVGPPCAWFDLSNRHEEGMVGEELKLLQSVSSDSSINDLVEKILQQAQQVNSELFGETLLENAALYKTPITHRNSGFPDRYFTENQRHVWDDGSFPRLPGEDPVGLWLQDRDHVVAVFPKKIDRCHTPHFTNIPHIPECCNEMGEFSRSGAQSLFRRFREDDRFEAEAFAVRLACEDLSPRTIKKILGRACQIPDDYF